MSEEVKKRKPRRGKGAFKIYPKLTVEYKDDPIRFQQLMKFILDTIELADMSPEEAEKRQKEDDWGLG